MRKVSAGVEPLLGSGSLVALGSGAIGRRGGGTTAAALFRDGRQLALFRDGRRLGLASRFVIYSAGVGAGVTKVPLKPI
jgi:hypothetical protein